MLWCPSPGSCPSTTTWLSAMCWCFCLLRSLPFPPSYLGWLVETGGIHPTAWDQCMRTQWWCQLTVPMTHWALCCMQTAAWMLLHWSQSMFESLVSFVLVRILLGHLICSITYLLFKLDYLNHFLSSDKILQPKFGLLPFFTLKIMPGIKFLPQNCWPWILMYIIICQQYRSFLSLI